MPETFNAQPNAPLVEKNNYASSAFVGYLNQFDQVPSGIVLGRYSPGVGPLQWIRSTGPTQTGLTMALTAGGTSITFDLQDGRMVNAVVTP
jgi:hypothetical protein